MPCLEVGGGARHGLDVDAPLLGVEAEGLEGALLAQDLGLVDELVAAVVAGPGVALAVLVGHHGADGLHHARGGEVLRGDQLQALRWRGGGGQEGQGHGLQEPKTAGRKGRSQRTLC